MSDYAKLAAEPRTVTGKEVKKLRRQGVMPGIIYGPAVDEPAKISVSARDFDVIYNHAGASSLIDVSVGTTSHTVFIRNVDRDPVKQTLVHAEFYAPRLDQETEMTVAIITVGETSDRGAGVLNHGRADVVVRGLPANIPQQFEVDLSVLANVDDSILVSDLQVPRGVEIVTPGDEVVVRLTAAQRATGPATAEEAEAEAGEVPETSAADENPSA